MTVLFWISALIVGYVYVGLSLPAGSVGPRSRTGGRGRAAFAGRRTGRRSPSSSPRATRRRGCRRGSPTSSIRHIPGRSEIIVVSDGSTDAPGAALAPFGRRVRLHRGAGRRQAAGAQRRRRARRPATILVFADARQRFAPGALAALVSQLSPIPASAAPPASSCSTASEHASVDTSVGEGIGALLEVREVAAPQREPRLVDARRDRRDLRAAPRAAGRRCRPATLLDDVLAPMRAVLDGCRIVFEERALAFDRASADAAAESRRKTRTLAGNYQILAQEPRLLLPVRQSRSGCSTCRTRSDAWSCRGRCVGLFVVEPGARARAACCIALPLFAAGRSSTASRSPARCSSARERLRARSRSPS